MAVSVDRGPSRTFKVKIFTLHATLLHGHTFCSNLVFPPLAAGTDEEELIAIDVDDRGGGVDKARGGQ